MSPSGLLSKPEFFRYLHLASSSVVAPASHNSGEEEHIKWTPAPAPAATLNMPSASPHWTCIEPAISSLCLDMPSASPRAIVNQDIDLTWL
ncbi:uncharacterized protein FFMR_04496 [Fusarium fujikuroi]|nr:uncharacterized protein FFMR_04496 [Fusarium fujikuroi]